DLARGSPQIDPTTVQVVSNPSHGVAVPDPNTVGNILYTPQDGFSGTDTFKYTVKDLPNATSNVATVSVLVKRPTAEADSAITFGTTPVTISVLANDSDPDGAGAIVPGSVTIVTQAGHGTATALGNGQVTYTPDAGFSG